MPILIAPSPVVAGAAAAAAPLGDTLVAMFFLFVMAGAFVFGSGLAIVPFLDQGVVQEFGCEHATASPASKQQTISEH